MRKIGFLLFPGYQPMGFAIPIRSKKLQSSADELYAERLPPPRIALHAVPALKGRRKLIRPPT